MSSVLKIAIACLLYKSFSDCRRTGINWKVITSPVIFGKDVQLECQLPRGGCSSRKTRSWRGGNDLRSLTVKGISSNITKYKEQCDDKKSISTLTIYSFDENDVNIVYECSYKFIVCQRLLKVTKSNYEYHPREVIHSPIKLISGDICNDTATILLSKVYPKPECRSYFQEDDTTNYLKVHHEVTSSFLYSIMIEYKNHIDHEGRLIIECDVGKSNFVVVNQSINCRDTDQKVITSVGGMDFTPLSILSICVLWGVPCFCCCFVLPRRKNVQLFSKRRRKSMKEQEDFSQRIPMNTTTV